MLMFGQIAVCNTVSILKNVWDKLSVNLFPSNEVKPNKTRFMTFKAVPQKSFGVRAKRGHLPTGGTDPLELREIWENDFGEIRK